MTPENKKGGSCGCGRSPSGSCVGWHRLTEEQYQELYKHYQETNEIKRDYNPTRLNLNQKND